MLLAFTYVEHRYNSSGLICLTQSICGSQETRKKELGVFIQGVEIAKHKVK